MCENIQDNFPGGVAACTGSFYGSSCNIKCGENHEMKGNNPTYCGADGEWIDLPECQLITCEIPTNLFPGMDLGRLSVIFNKVFKILF